MRIWDRLSQLLFFDWQTKPRNTEPIAHSNSSTEVRLQQQRWSSKPLHPHEATCRSMAMSSGRPRNAGCQISRRLLKKVRMWDVGPLVSVLSQNRRRALVRPRKSDCNKRHWSSKPCSRVKQGPTASEHHVGLAGSGDGQTNTTQLTSLPCVLFLAI